MILKDVEPFEAYDCKTGGCGYERESFDAYVNGMQHVLEDLDSQPEIDPESLPVVQQLRAEVERLNKGIENFSKNVESAYKQRDELRAELEKVKAEQDAALNIGDSVWQTDGIDVYELKVKRLIYDCGYIAFDASAVGKRIFKTSSEAETAMAKAKEAAHE